MTLCQNVIEKRKHLWISNVLRIQTVLLILFSTQSSTFFIRNSLSRNSNFDLKKKSTVEVHPLHTVRILYVREVVSLFLHFDSKLNFFLTKFFKVHIELDVQYLKSIEHYDAKEK